MREPPDVFVIARLDWQLAVVGLLVAPLLVFFTRRYRLQMRPRYREVKGIETNAMQIIQEALGAIRVVKAFAQGGFERQRLGAKSLESVEAALYARRVRSLLGPVVTAMVAIGTAAAVLIGLIRILAQPLKSAARSSTRSPASHA